MPSRIHQAHETNIMGTMNLLAGSEGADRLVVKSSAAVNRAGVDPTRTSWEVAAAYAAS